MVSLRMIGLVAVIAIGAAGARANVLNMTGATSLLFVPVGNPGNAADTRYATSGHGAVSYTYNMGKFEVTAGQYCEFLNKVAATDTYGLYNTLMNYDSNPTYYNGCNIKRSGTNGSYSYSVAADWANRPVNYVSWGDAARFANWLTNGQPSGPQGTATTEDGSYVLNGAITQAALMTIARKPNAHYVIPSDDEWYKAAYYDPSKSGGAGYWDWPTRSNTLPSSVLNDPDTGNSANYNEPIGSPYHRTVVGDYENSASAYGTYDQGGNVFEWDEGTVSTLYRDIRSDSFRSGGPLAMKCSYSNYVDPAANESDTVGFRIAEVPEPGTMAIMAIGAMAWVSRRIKVRP